jgi:hypothetical protein
LRIENCKRNALEAGAMPTLAVGMLKTGGNRNMPTASVGMAPNLSATNTSFQFSIFNFQFVLLLIPLLLVPGCKGCRDSTATSRQADSGDAATSGQFHEDLLTYAIDNLNRLEEFESADVLQQMFQRLNPQQATKAAQSDQLDPVLTAWPEPEMLRQIVDRLNQWIRTQQPPADWALDPMVASLPKPLAELPQVKELSRMAFARFDGYALQEAVWLRDIGLWARGDVLDDLDRAKNLFDWTVRNIQLDADSPDRVARFPWETLLFGHGTATERAWVFILLARQLGIDAAMLDVVEEAEGGGRKAEGGGRKTGEAEQPAAKDGTRSVPPSALRPPPSARPWCVAVLIEGNAYLFDPALGLPIPAPNGVTRDETGQLAIQPATLAQVAADEKLLRRLDVDAAHVYGISASDLKHVTVMLEASPTYLSKRMKLLESHLGGKQKMTLSTSPAAQARRWKGVKDVADVRLWLHPFETLDRCSHLDQNDLRQRLEALLPLYAKPTAPLCRGRILYLKGKFVGDGGATEQLQAARPAENELTASSAPPAEKYMSRRGKQDAGYWLGLIAYQRGKYRVAAFDFVNLTLRATPPGPWISGARYNLARTLEAAGETDRAVIQYQSNAESPGYLGDLLRAKWLREQGGGRRVEGGESR